MENCHYDYAPFNSKGKLSLRSYFFQIERKTVTINYNHIPFKLNGKREYEDQLYAFMISKKFPELE